MTGKFQGKTIKKRGDIPLGLLCILAVSVLIAPVAGLAIVDGTKIISTNGATSPMIIIESGLPYGANLTINVRDLNDYVNSRAFTTENVVLDDAAVAAGWTFNVEDGMLNLTSPGGPSTEFDMVTVTFTGATNPWIANTEKDQIIPLTATMPDPSEFATINFMIQTGGLSVKNGETIRSPNGITSPVITINNATIEEGYGFIIDVSNINWFAIATGPITMDNIIIEDTADAATWAGELTDENTLSLTQTGGPSVEGETITVTFTGATNPWIENTGGPQSYPLPVTRTDGFGVGIIDFAIETGVLGGITAVNEDTITSQTGTSSTVITITDQQIDPNGNITINIGDIQEYVANRPFTRDNVIVEDTSAAANWTFFVEGNMLTLTSTDGATLPEESVTVTFTGATNPWVVDSHGDYIRTLTATRTDTGQFATFDFAIQIVPVGDVTVTDGAMISTTDGTTSPVITITYAAIAAERTITINITDLHQYVANHTFATDNVVVSDTAGAAEWTGVVTGDTLTLTSTGGLTLPEDSVLVTFTGATNPWIAYTDGERRVGLTATRTDTGQSGTVNFTINTGAMVADFSASPRSDYVPAAIAFTDLSTGSPNSWSWDFGDGGSSTGQNPTHLYEKAGSYNVTMTVWNAQNRVSLISKMNYINILNNTIKEADTSIAGLTIENCGGPQTVTVDTSLLIAVLSAGNSVLEIQPPTGSGFKNITFYGSFSQISNQNLITGNPTSVHLESEDIAPSLGFSNDIGSNASFYFSVDLPSYPCNAKLSTEISEGVAPDCDSKFRQIASANDAFPVGTAYTAKITKTNFPSGTPVIIYMSVNSSWRPSLYGDYIFIWRIADDETYGQMLPTYYLYSDPVKNLDYYEADSPLGLSTIGISATTGNNNPFQMIIFAATNAINQGGNAQSSSGSSMGTSVSTNAVPGSPNSDLQGGPIETPAPVAPNKPEPLNQPAMTTNIGMAVWLLAMVQNNPIILVGVAGVIAAAAYFGWWKRRL